MCAGGIACSAQRHPQDRFRHHTQLTQNTQPHFFCCIHRTSSDVSAHTHLCTRCTLFTPATPFPSCFVSLLFSSTFSKSLRNTYQLLLFSLCLISFSSLHTLIEKLLISSFFEISHTLYSHTPTSSAQTLPLISFLHTQNIHPASFMASLTALLHSEHS